MVKRFCMPRFAEQVFFCLSQKVYIMKKFIISAIVFCQILIVQAQTWVQVPDANFQNWLSSAYPDDINIIDSDFFINAESEDVLSTDSLNLSGLGISDLTGIVAFSNLQILHCNYNQLTALPNLPATLIDFRCEENQLSSLTDLPANLQIFSCSDNAITALPELPSTLTHLLCSENQLTSLPELPSNLEHLNCMYNVLTELPSLPQGLTYLGCSFNQLLSLPNLSSSLEILHCVNNQLGSLPELPSMLEHLYCSNNQLTSLPDLPENLEFLFCGNNQLSSVPTLPENLSVLFLLNNEISCFPFFPASLVLINIDENPYTCLPNYTIALGPDLSDFPLCQANDSINNPNNCASFMTSNVLENKPLEINIFPNPAQNHFFVQWDNMPAQTIRIYSTSGVLVHEQAVLEGVDLVKISTDNLARGVYIVQFGEVNRMVVVE